MTKRAHVAHEDMGEQFLIISEVLSHQSLQRRDGNHQLIDESRVVRHRVLPARKASFTAS